MSIRASIAEKLETDLRDDPELIVNTDTNVPFTPPDDLSWVEVRFVDGAESLVSIGGVTSLARQPVNVYVDIHTPLGQGDGEAVEIAARVKNSLRRLSVPEGRWLRFEEGPEGEQDGDYRKQVVAVFLRRARV